MSLRIGLMTFVTDQSMSVVDLAREAETRGFDSLFVPEKTHLPVSRRTAWPGGDLPETYKRTFDPFVALSAAAAVTDTIRLGTGICMAVARDPIVTAKEVASIDVLSQGRFIFGVGYGWNAEEIEDHGVPFDERAAVLRDKVLAMKAIWSADEAGYEGDHVSFEPTWSWPKPLQHPHPPIVMGSRASAANFGDIAEYCDGWMADRILRQDGGARSQAKADVACSVSRGRGARNCQENPVGQSRVARHLRARALAAADAARLRAVLWLCGERDPLIVDGRQPVATLNVLGPYVLHNGKTTVLEYLAQLGRRKVRKPRLSTFADNGLKALPNAGRLSFPDLGRRDIADS